MNRFAPPSSARVTVAVLAISLQACAADTAAYPSLAKRDAERISGTAPVVKPDPGPPVAATPNADLAIRLDQLIAQGRAAHDRFASREARARQLAVAARGAALGTESWAVASIALADLESARSDAMIALADLDALYAQAKVAGSDTVQIEQARSAVIALVTVEDRVLADLRGQLAG